MEGSINKSSPEATQPPLFAPDGSPSPEVIKALQQLEEETNRAFREKLKKEIEENIKERSENHAP